MNPMSVKECREFRIFISSRPLPELQKIFNQLAKDAGNDHLSDHARGIASAKARMVKAEMNIRKAGGFSG